MPSDMTEEQIKKEEAVIKQQVTMAIQNTKEVGNLPSDIKDIITEMEGLKSIGLLLLEELLGEISLRTTPTRDLTEELYIVSIYTILAL